MWGHFFSDSSRKQLWRICSNYLLLKQLSKKYFCKKEIGQTILGLEDYHVLEVDINTK